MPKHSRRYHMCKEEEEKGEERRENWTKLILL
jgi:hypothetical protein